MLLQHLIETSVAILVLSSPTHILITGGMLEYQSWVELNTAQFTFGDP